MLTNKVTITEKLGKYLIRKEFTIYDFLLMFFIPIVNPKSKIIKAPDRIHSRPKDGT